jgi:hypothetical protein
MLTMVLQELVPQATGPALPITITLTTRWGANPLIDVTSTVGALTRTVTFHREEARAFAEWFADWVLANPAAV